MNIRLRVVQGRPAGQELTFGPGEYYFGRGPECQVRLNSDWVSRQHCRLRVEDGRVTLRDLSSRNGTLLNGALLTAERPLRDGDQVQIGPVAFAVRLDTSSHALPSSLELLPPEGAGGEAHETDATKQHPPLRRGP